MTYGRWYPTGTTLADGRVLVTSGGTNCPNCNVPGDPHNGLADIAEIYNPATNTWTQLSSVAVPPADVSPYVPAAGWPHLRQQRECGSDRECRPQPELRRPGRRLARYGTAAAR